MAQNWFKHDYNSRNDDDVLELRAEHGWKGYGLFYAFIETMAENEKGAIDLDKIGGLSIGYNLPKEELLAFVETCLDIGLFYKDDDGLVRNKRITNHVDKLRSFREAGKKGAKKRWSNESDRGANEGGNSNSNATPNTDKSREEESKEEQEQDARDKDEYIRNLAVSDFKKEEQVKRFAVYCWQCVKENYPNHKTVHEAKFSTWYDPLRLLIENDGLNLTTAKRLWDYAVNHERFWKQNIRSTSKFRQQWETIDAQMERAAQEKEDKQSLGDTNRFRMLKKQSKAELTN